MHREEDDMSQINTFRKTAETGPIECDREDLPVMGWINIGHMGEENMYFTTEADPHTVRFVKVDA